MNSVSYSLDHPQPLVNSRASEFTTSITILEFSHAKQITSCQTVSATQLSVGAAQQHRIFSPEVVPRQTDVFPTQGKTWASTSSDTVSPSARSASTRRPRSTVFQTVLTMTTRFSSLARFNKWSDSPLFSPASRRWRNSESRHHSTVNRVRCLLPNSGSVSASSYWRGKDASFVTISEAS